MALTLHTNVGFVTTAPSADPAGSGVTSDGSSFVVKDTAPTGAVLITEVGWYKESGTTSSNTQVGLYSDSAGVADVRLQVTGDQASGTSAGWIRFTGLSWPITAGTAYWLGMQQDAHTGSSGIDSASSGGSGIDTRTSQTALTNPYGGGAVADADGMYAIYAVYQTAPTVALSSPADSATGVSTTPDLVFTGTDTDSDDVRYEVQVGTSSFVDVSTSNLTTGTDTDGGSSSTTASVTPTANKLQLLTVASRTGITADPNEPTATGNSLTWVVEKSVVYDNSSSSRRRITTFRAMGASPSSGTITIDFGGQAQTSVIWSLNEVTGADTSGTNGSGAIVQSVSNFDASATVNTLTVSLASFGNVNNATFGAFATGDAETLSTGSGFTSISEGDSGDGNIHLLTEFKNTNDTSVDMSKASNSEIGGIAIEIKSATQALIDAVSGTDAGFSGSPDNSDPFASGQAVTYTVQSALSNSTTYYWRVRAIDPSGSNTYGAWATTRSFTTTSGSTDKTVSPGVQTLTLSQSNPTITATKNKTVSPGVQTLTASQLTPTITAVKNVTTSPNVQTLTVSQSNPTITVGDGALVSTQTLTASLSSPTITTIQNRTVSPNVQSLTVSQNNPTVQISKSVSVNTQALTSSLNSPSISTIKNATILPSVQSLTASVYDPEVTAETSHTGVTVSPNVQTLTASLSSPTTLIGDGASPSTLTLTASQSNPTVTTIRNVTVHPLCLDLGAIELIYDDKINFYKHISGRLYMRI